MKLSYLILSCCAIFFLSCAENPSPVVDSFGGFSRVDDLKPAESYDVNSVVFEGTDLFGKSCRLALSVVQENSNDIFLVKMDYIIHSVVLPSLRTSLYRFDIGTNSYNDPQSGVGAVTLGGATLKNGITADLNNLANYEASGDLIFSLRVETNAASSVNYTNALKQVVNDPSQLAAFSSTLDQISRIIFKVTHAGHYDAAGCVGLKLTKVVKQEIKI